MKTTIALLDKHGNNAVETVLETLRTLHAGQPTFFALALPQIGLIQGNIDTLTKQGVSSSVVAGFSASEKLKRENILSADDVAFVFEGRLYSPISETSLFEQVAKEPLHCETILQALIQNADGDYSFFMLKDGWIAAGRDPIGVQPLYYGENKDFAALASNRKALWRLGIEQSVSFPPGSLVFVNREGFRFKSVKKLTFEEPEPLGMQEAAGKLQALLQESVQRRVHGLKKVAVAFSGGLDSSLVAFLADKCGVQVNLIHISLENQLESEEAIRIADELNLPLQVHLFKESDLEAVLPKVVELIEEPDSVKTSIGVPFYWTAERAAECGLKVLLAGQGADELFGGYQRYVNEYCFSGNKKVSRLMFNDVASIHESNLERDNKICAYHDVELRLPFASFEIAKFALSLPVELKIERKPDCLRKLILRKVASNVGLPFSAVEKPKKAVQYSTGISSAIKKIAKKHGKSLNEYVNELFSAVQKA